MFKFNLLSNKFSDSSFSPHKAKDQYLMLLISNSSLVLRSRLFSCCADSPLTVSCDQVPVGPRKNNIILQRLQPDTKYLVSVASVYPWGVSKEITNDGRTSEEPDTKPQQ